MPLGVALPVSVRALESLPELPVGVGLCPCRAAPAPRGGSSAPGLGAAAAPGAGLAPREGGRGGETALQVSSWTPSS